MITLSSIFLGLSFIINVAWIIVIFRKITLKRFTIHHILFLNLSLSTVLGSIANWMYPMATIYEQNGDLLKFNVRMFRCSLSATAMTIFSFALLRFLAIFRPFTYHSFVGNSIGIGEDDTTGSIKTTKCLCGSVLMCIWGISLVPFVFYKLGDEKLITSELLRNLLYAWLVLILTLLVIIPILYVKIYFEVHRILSVESFVTTDRRGIRRDRKAMVTTVILTVSLLICFLPFVVIRMIIEKDRRVVENDDTTFMDVFYRFVYFLPFVNFISDPIIYGLGHHDVKRAMVSTLRDIKTWSKRSRRSLRFRRRQSRSSQGVTSGTVYIQCDTVIPPAGNGKILRQTSC
ncbi:unnamed protein product [Owenia fusiformis]|uniref:G-protein coupled receptors family 1 profile domain-containing protein n=1 Tax=Owenia fusiformis TaxID=6347 RepID=A0A8S4P4H6_OWEFU|nr:unnamed protein product [Owenia fusiformis]